MSGQSSGNESASLHIPRVDGSSQGRVSGNGNGILVMSSEEVDRVLLREQWRSKVREGYAMFSISREWHWC